MPEKENKIHGCAGHTDAECVSGSGDGNGTIRPLNDFLELTIGGVTYRVRSVFADKGQIGEMLDLAAMEKINRIA